MRLPKRSVFHRPHEEISHLYTLFYPTSLDAAQADAARRRGVDLVHHVYLSRSSSPCPVAIECTAALVDALLLDAALSPSIGGASGSAVRSALSLSLIRLVNSLADSLQQGVYAKSIAAIAERQLGLPQSFVEFRHRATHEYLPSLTVCREAAIAVSESCMFVARRTSLIAFCPVAGPLLASNQLLDPNASSARFASARSRRT